MRSKDILRRWKNAYQAEAKLGPRTVNIPLVYFIEAENTETGEKEIVGMYIPGDLGTASQAGYNKEDETREIGTG